MKKITLYSQTDNFKFINVVQTIKRYDIQIMLFPICIVNFSKSIINTEKIQFSSAKEFLLCCAFVRRIQHIRTHIPKKILKS